MNDGLQGYSSAYAALSGSRYISIGPSTALDTVFRPATAPFYQPYVPWMARPYTLEASLKVKHLVLLIVCKSSYKTTSFFSHNDSSPGNRCDIFLRKKCTVMYDHCNILNEDLIYLDFRNAASAPLGKHRRNRTAFSQQQLAALEQTFAKTQYPDLENRESLSRKTGLPEPKIQRILGIRIPELSQKDKITSKMLRHFFCCAKSFDVFSIANETCNKKHKICFT
ncbi:UNVERIFIED_CONTAM: gsb [Trichonephila clavipes]